MKHLNRMDQLCLQLGSLYEKMGLKNEAKFLYLSIQGRVFKKDKKSKEKPLKTNKDVLKQIKKRLKKL